MKKESILYTFVALIAVGTSEGFRGSDSSGERKLTTRGRRLQMMDNGDDEETPAPIPSPTPVPTTPPPTNPPTPLPTRSPTDPPTRAPTATPTGRPSAQPSVFPTDVPSSSPTELPVLACGEKIESPIPRGDGSFRFNLQLPAGSNGVADTRYYFYNQNGIISFEYQGQVTTTGEQPADQLGDFEVSLTGASRTVEVLVETVPASAADSAYWIMQTDCP